MVRNIRIGKVISGTLSERNITLDDLAKKVEIPERILSLMLKNDDLGCNVLYKISSVLEYDFFRYYSFQLIQNNNSDRTMVKPPVQKSENIS